MNDFVESKIVDELEEKRSWLKFASISFLDLK